MIYKGSAKVINNRIPEGINYRTVYVMKIMPEFVNYNACFYLTVNNLKSMFIPAVIF